MCLANPQHPKSFLTTLTTAAPMSSSSVHSNFLQVWQVLEAEAPNFLKTLSEANVFPHPISKVPLKFWSQQTQKEKVELTEVGGLEHLFL